MSKKIDCKSLKNVSGGATIVDLTDEIICPKCHQTIKKSDIIHLNGYDICPKCNQKMNDMEGVQAVFT